MKRYALVVGIDRYKCLGHLAKAAYDAQEMHALLVEHGQFDEEPVLLLKATAVGLIRWRLARREIALSRAVVTIHCVCET